MSQPWRNLILTLTVTAIFFTSCKKKYSSDDPLPTSYYPSVILNSDHQVYYAIDPITGKKNWEFSMLPLYGVPTTVFTPSPLLYNGMLYLTAINSDTIYKVNAKTGLLVKKLMPVPYSTYPAPAHFFFVVATPVADGNLIYLATSNDTLYAVDTGTGNVAWKYGAESPLKLFPTIYNGNLYFASTGGHVYCVPKATGTSAAPTPNVPIWDYPGDGGGPIGSFVSSPAICPPYLYIGSVNDSNMYCIYLNPPAPTPPLSGLLRWTFKTGGAIYSSPTAFAGLCIFGSNDFNVYCVDTQTAVAKWHFQTNSRINSSPIIDNQTVYIGSDDYYLYSLNIINGKKKWGFKTNGLLKSSPVPYQGTIFIGSYDGNIYAVDSAKGDLKWQYMINGNIESSPVIDNLGGNNQNVSQVSGFKN